MSKYETFARLHDDFLILPNAWDAGSARLMQHAGAKAIATSSAAVAWTHGYADGEAMPPALALQTVRAIVDATDLPVSADIEAGYAADANAAAARALEVLDAGAVGINIEDGTGAPDLLAAKIEAIQNAARSKGTQIWINARVDVFLKGIMKGEEGLKESIRRGQLYASAGANSIFVPAVVDAASLKELTGNIRLPLNVLAWGGLPDAATLKSLGVKRLSAGSGIALRTNDLAHSLAQAFLADGKSEHMAGATLTNPALNGIMRK
ncbi:MAG TPA: isocitrate lyase/phosphoenolpyruvate mutase family protein [Rhizomicrobium sp.]|jgi:2-methylisocitrate lyase-like PEP mutase family enzyme|nr:isocitrate lyase/phosphoenolpyruvate mutase family protein [Rhizomicrobium sp.]